MSNNTPAKDHRVEKLRKLLREGSTITKEDFLDFVVVYKHFYEAGFKLRPGLAKWFQENEKTILEWRPEVLRVRPGFFDDIPPNSNSTFREYPILVALGLARDEGHSEQETDDRTVSPKALDLGVTSSLGKLKELSDFGSPIPESAVGDRPSLSGKFQQNVWVDDIKEVVHHLTQLKTWLMESANRLTPHDPMTETMETAARRVPDFVDRIRTAQLCFDDVKSKYEASTAELLRGRARVRRYSPAPLDDAEREGTARVAADNETDTTLKSLSASILVVSDIVGNESITAGGSRVNNKRPPPSGSTAPSAEKGPQVWRQTNGPRDSNAITPLRGIPRRSAMPLNTTHTLKRKYPGEASSSDPFSGQESSDSEDESASDHEQITSRGSKRDLTSTTGAKSVYSIASDDESLLSAKRARVVLGEARRPQNGSGGVGK
ncbi:hypothetical protein QBC34DRAFT_415404 [Podospora aff. communis PSN243]|uniref:HAUS augmin-like complex subunit 6 N-terminal domain-containing protein n=1 Tax=Podospora aff. communis PSN243 TaxID=3040156 RepID=A0AAV9G8M2_9PEZI|nr:hypothetical protein QBC34DRAFT_415404 [Podospora aff. communis PSN243]